MIKPVNSPDEVAEALDLFGYEDSFDVVGIDDGEMVRLLAENLAWPYLEDHQWDMTLERAERFEDLFYEGAYGAGALMFISRGPRALRRALDLNNKERA